ncbi:hypothetical protein [Paraburkholderia sabiae]|uniref:hypothetical protein n=1 Tax=Paraburkholderia sabiae TaxID=273251 RepID=UPI001CC766E1|nr:hypothetical protein [Paraburkholderia sabiae]
MSVALCIALTGCERTSSEQRVAQTVAIYEVPQAVKRTIDRQSHGGSVSAIEKWTTNGKTFYEAPVSRNGQQWELTIGEDGKLVAERSGDDEDDD